MGNLNLAKLDTLSDSNLCELLTSAENAVDQAKKVAQQLLVFSKGQKPVKKPTLVRRLISETSGFALAESSAQCTLQIKGNSLRLSKIYNQCQAGKCAKFQHRS